ncbi:MAG: Hydroxylamine reductase [Firmicutes bacterium ADurb.Bin193]|nr:MAG: Hydroxylamine reductase [Firmicutes bacterium ADurb.Bin193]
MFCFQCEQTAGGVGCTKGGVCGKTPVAADTQDRIMGALVGLARSVNNGKRTEKTDEVMVKGLFSCITNVNFDEEKLNLLVAEINAENPNGESLNIDMNNIWTENEDVRSLRVLLLLGLKGMAAYYYHANALGYYDDEVMQWFYGGMSTIAEQKSIEEWLELLNEFGFVNLKCMELLDRANTESFGNPVPTEVSAVIEKGPFIVVSGHDLHDLKLLLEQTQGKGINIYTHGEMLPCHAYPRLKQYPHLKGNFGTAWQNQQKEFADVPGAFLFTTNCLMPPKSSYADRVFTTAVVGYPGLVHIGEDKDFSVVIKKALSLGGYAEDTAIAGINGGVKLTTGFGHATVLSVADKVIDAVKAGVLKHIFLVGGCDGAKPGRNYFTDFVKGTPADSVVLTLACGKFRFNDLALGTLGGLPRIMDMGQCNDAYSAIKVAGALAKAFDCEINDLPLSLVLSWYEQKAVCILLTLLSLGVKNIRLGPTLPAFVSPNVLKVLVDNYNIKPITTPEKDLQDILG